MKKSIRHAGILAFGMTAILLVLFGACSRRSNAGVRSANLDATGEILYLEGDVTLNGLEAAIGDETRNGDVLVTGPDSYAEVSFGEYRVFRAKENTNLTLKASENTLNLDRGALAVVQSKARFLSREKPWEVETATAVAAVRGTVYYVEIEEPGTTYYCLCNGALHLEDIEGGGAVDLEAAHHAAVRYRRDGDKIVREEAAMLYHSDEDMESLADRVNVAIDWTKVP